MLEMLLNVKVSIHRIFRTDLTVLFCCLGCIAKPADCSRLLTLAVDKNEIFHDNISYLMELHTYGQKDIKREIVRGGELVNLFL